MTPGSPQGKRNGKGVTGARVRALPSDTVRFKQASQIRRLAARDNFLSLWKADWLMFYKK